MLSFNFLIWLDIHVGRCPIVFFLVQLNVTDLLAHPLLSMGRGRGRSHNVPDASRCSSGATRAPPPNILQGTISRAVLKLMDKPFTFVRKVGEGSFATLWFAEDQATGDPTFNSSCY